MFRNLEQSYTLMMAGEITPSQYYQVLISYRGLLKHCNSYKLERELDSRYRFTR